MPLDLFEAAGIIARLRLEASVNVRASVSAAMSLDEMRSLVTGALPLESRPTWTSCSTRSALARRSGRVLVRGDGYLGARRIDQPLPKDGSGPGVTAYFHYGFGWGFGAGWGVISNVGFDLKRMLRRTSDQAKLDLRASLQAFRRAEGLRTTRVR